MCVVEQLPVLDGVPASGSGWYLEESTLISRRVCGDTPRIVFTADARPSTRFGTHLSCSYLARATTLSIGSPCPAPSTGCAELEVHDGRRCEYDLVCDPQTGTLELPPCTADDPCPSEWTCEAGACKPTSCRVE